MATAIKYGLIASLVAVTGIWAINATQKPDEPPKDNCHIESKAELADGSTGYTVICPAGKSLDPLAAQADVEIVPPG